MKRDLSVLINQRFQQISVGLERKFAILESKMASSDLHSVVQSSDSRLSGSSNLPPNLDQLMVDSQGWFPWKCKDRFSVDVQQNVQQPVHFHQHVPMDLTPRQLEAVKALLTTEFVTGQLGKSAAPSALVGSREHSVEVKTRNAFGILRETLPLLSTLLSDGNRSLEVVSQTSTFEILDIETTKSMDAENSEDLEFGSLHESSAHNSEAGESVMYVHTEGEDEDEFNALRSWADDRNPHGGCVNEIDNENHQSFYSTADPEQTSFQETIVYKQSLEDLDAMVLQKISQQSVHSKRTVPTELISGQPDKGSEAMKAFPTAEFITRQLGRTKETKHDLSGHSRNMFMESRLVSDPVMKTEWSKKPAVVPAEEELSIDRQRRFPDTEASTSAFLIRDSREVDRQITVVPKEKICPRTKRRAA